MPLGTTKHPAVGTRVELPAWSDQWMRGARFGTVARVIDRSNKRFLDPRDLRSQDIWLVRCDHPQIKRLYRHFDFNFTVV